jgi:hypothetical protein
MAETLLLYTAVERFNKESNEAKKLALAKEMYARFMDPSSESPDTVTLGLEVVQQVQEQLATGEVTNSLFGEARVEILMLMSSNALVDFLTSLSRPSLEDCFVNPHRPRFLACAARLGRLSDVVLVEAILAYESKPLSTLLQK